MLDEEKESTNPGAKGHRYQVVRRLAAGGMSELLEGYALGSLGFRKPVAIKRLLREDSEYVGLFEEEAKTAALLEHPNLVSCLDATTVGGRPSLIMELLDGVTVGQLLTASVRAGTPPPVPLTVHIIAEVAAGLHHAHELTCGNGQHLALVHRDVAPSNIMLTAHGTVKLLDFGIAKHAQSSLCTQAGIRRGRCGYIAPEYVLRQKIDRRVDVYSLGLVLSEMLTLVPAVRGVSLMETAPKIVRGQLQTARKLRPELPETLLNLIDMMTATKPERRLPDCRSVGLILRSILAHEITAVRDTKSVLENHVRRVKAQVDKKADAERGFNERTTKPLSSPPTRAPDRPARLPSQDETLPGTFRSGIQRRPARSTDATPKLLTLMAVLMACIASAATIAIYVLTPPSARVPTSSANAIIQMTQPAAAKVPFAAPGFRAGGNQQ